VKSVKDPRLLTSKILIQELCDKEAEIECLDSGLIGQSGPMRTLSERIYSLKTELMGRMGKDSRNEDLLDELVKLYKNSVNSGEDKPLELRNEIRRRKAQILKIIKKTSNLQTA
jgi:hypothetical protein